jgi:hypothetical protein
MSSVTRYRQYAADCIRQAQAEQTIEDRTILLNVALAWLRLAQQLEERRESASPPTAPEHLVAEPSGANQHELTF